MPLQTQVYTSVASGIPGMKADMNAFDYYPNSLMAEEPVTIGTFVWLGTNPEIHAGYGGNGAPVGFVERNIVYPNYNILDEGSMIAAEGEALSIATSGCFWAQTVTDAAVGQSVFAAMADGAISAANAGDTVAGAVETGWRVCTAGEAGATIMIKRL